VHAAIYPTGQIPDQPGVDGAKAQFAVFRLFTRSGSVVQQPADLGAGKIRVGRKPDYLAEAVLTAISSQLVHETSRTGILPDNRIGDRTSGCALPHDGGLALVGDAASRDFGEGNIGSVQRAANDVKHRVPNLKRVMLHPAWSGVDLGVFFLIGSYDGAAVVEDNTA